MKIKKVLAAALLASAMTGCTKTKLVPATWNDVARTIPADVEYVAAVELNEASDSVFRMIVGTSADDMTRLMDDGLALCTKRPTHVVVVGFGGSTYVTWPLPNPTLVAENTAKWPKVALNNAVDARERTIGAASLIISDTQAWVVNSKNGADCLNDLLDAAMSSKAAMTVPLNQCITAATGIRAVVPFRNRYITVDVAREAGRLHADFASVDGAGESVAIVKGLKPLNADTFADVAPTGPMVSLAADSGAVKEWLGDVTKYIGSAKGKIALRTLAPMFAQVKGPVTATLDRDELRFEVNYASTRSAASAARRLGELADGFGADVRVAVDGRAVTIVTPSPGFVEGLRLGTPTPDRPLTTPSAVAYARFDVDKDLAVDIFIEMAATAGTLDLVYPDTEGSEEKIVEFVKMLIPKKM